MAFSKEDEVGTIYEGTSGSGTPYLNMTINGQKFVAFRNKFKEAEKHPDWKVYKSKPREVGRQNYEPVGRSASTVTDDDIAF